MSTDISTSGSQNTGAARITVAICTYKRYALLRGLLYSLDNQILARSMFKVLVVDNTDDEAEREQFRREVQGNAGLEVVYSSPPGLSRARNVAIEKCHTEFIVFIDDDALPSPEWLSAHLAAFDRSGASVIAGPIDPIWPVAKPHWIPEKFIACLTVLDLGPEDRVLSEYEFAYGTNIAFRTSALRETGGFNVGLGRAGNRTLVSDEEVETQLALQKRGHKRYYAATARVSHLVHANRISRNYFRSRMAWQAVSTLLHDSPLWWLEQSRQEIMRASTELGVGPMVQQLLTHRDAATLTRQIDLIYHLLLVILNANNESDDAFERPFMMPVVPAASPGAAVVPAVPASAETPYRYCPVEPIGMGTRHLFIDSPTSHGFLYDTYGDINGAQMFSIPGNLWENCAAEFEKLSRSIGPQVESVIFTTLEAFIFGASWEHFDALLNGIKVPVFGILHRLPGSDEHAHRLREISARIQIIVLAESMVDRLQQEYAVADVIYLPLHPTHSAYIGREVEKTRKAAGVGADQYVFSVLGEARKGKGIEILLEALPFVAPEDRSRMFFLFGGRAKEFDPEAIESQLADVNCSGLVDLRRSSDPLNYAVLTEKELGQYMNITDTGVLLYQEDQRNCMSGVLPNHVWGRKPVIATSNSIIGKLVKKYNVGIALDEETPQAVAAALSTALRACIKCETGQYVNESFRASIATDAVVQCLASILGNRPVTNA